MKKIYVSHSTKFDFKEDLYRPLRKIKGFQLIFPHDKSSKIKKSKNIIKNCYAVIAEVSEPSHGVGIELGWADSFGIPIILICRRGSKTSGSLKTVYKKLIEYDHIEDVLPEIENILSKVQK